MIFKYDKENGFDVNEIFKDKQLSPTIDREKLQDTINLFNNSKLSADAFSESMHGIDDALLSYLKTCKNGEAYMTGFDKHVANTNKSIGLMGVKSKIAAVGVGILNSVLSAGIGILAGFVISGIIKFFDALIETQEELAEAAAEAQAKIDELSSSLQKNRDLVKDTAKRYAELAQGVNNFNGKNVNLSNEEYEEFLNLSNQLAEAFPGLVKGYIDGEYAILDLSGSVDTIVTSLNKLIETEQLLASQETAESLPKVIEDAQSKVKTYKDEITKLKEQQKLLNQFMSNDNLDKKITEVSNSLGSTIFRVDVLGEFDSFKTEAIKKQLLGIFGESSSFNGKRDINKIIDGEANKIGEQFIISTDQDIFGDFEKYFYDNMGVFDEISNSISSKISKFNADIDKEFSSILPTINTALYSDSDFSILDDNIQTAIQSIVSNLNLDGIEDVETYIKNNIIGLFDESNLSDDLQTKLLNLFTIDRTQISDNDYVKLYENVVSEIQSYFIEHDIKIPLHLDFLDFMVADENEAEKRLQSYINSKAYKDTYGQQQVSNYMREKGIDTAEEKDLFIEITQDANNALEMIQLFEAYLNSLVTENKFKLFTEENNEVIDAFQEKVSKANEYIQMIEDGSITDSDVIDIAQEMGLDVNEIDLMSDSYEGLKEQLIAISNLEFDNISNKLDNLLASGEIDQETYDQLIDSITLIKLSYEKTYDGMESLSGGMSDLQTSFNSLTDAKREYDETEKISYETVQALSSAYPELEQELMNYLSGITDGKTIIESLNEAYNADLMNYKTYYAEKHKNDIDFYNQILANIPDNVKARFEEYKFDLENYKSLAEAKLQIEKNLADEIYKQKLRENVQPKKRFMDSDITGTRNMMYNESDPEPSLKEQADEEAKSLSDALNKGVELAITLPEIKYTGSKDSDSEKINEIDWATNSIENLTNKINSLNNALENEPNYKKQLDIIKDLKDAQEDLITLRENAVTEYSTRYDDSLKKFSSSELTTYKPLIESDTALSLEMFEGENRQKVFEKVSAAQKAWQDYQQALIDYEDQVVVVADTQKLEYQTEQDAYQNKIDRHENNKSDIQNKIDKQETKYGYADEELYQDLLDENNKLLDDYNAKLENAKANRKKIAQEEGKNSQAYLEADNEVQELQDHVSDLTQEQIELNRTILKYPIHKLEEAKEELEEQLEVYKERQSKLESAIAGASNILQDEIDTYNDLKESITDSYDLQIKAINDKKDALTETNDALKEQMALEQAQYNLDRALNQKTVKVIRNKQVVYEADARAVIDAQKQLDEEKYNIAVSSFDKQINNLEEQKENALKGIDDQIERLQDYKDKIDSIVGSYEKALQLQSFLSLFNTDGNGIERLLNMDESLYGDMSNQYIDVSANVTSTEEKIKTIEDTIKEIELIATRWDGAKKTIKKAKKEIEDTLANTEKEFQAIKDRNEAAKTINKQWKKVKEKTAESLALIETDQINYKDSEKPILDERLANIKSFAEQASAYLASVSSSIDAINSKSISPDLNTGEITVPKGQQGSGSNKTSKAIDASKIVIAGALASALSKFHDGMEQGFVGDISNKDDTFKHVALTKLKPDEVPTVLQVGEGVLTKLQQKNVLDNMRTAFYAGVKLPNFNNIQKANTTTSAPSITLNGDIVLQGVQNTTEFAQKIKSEFLTKLSQELYK